MSNLDGLAALNTNKATSRRKPEEFFEGRHEPLYPMELFLLNQQIRAGKANTPTSTKKSARVYLLTGVGRCYECWVGNPHQTTVSLRGVTGNGYTYYRCATHQEYYCSQRRRVSEGKDVQPTPEAGLMDALLQRHSLLPAKKVEQAVENLIAQIQLPDTWFETILAYVVTRHGLTDFERESHNLRAELERLQKMFQWGHLCEADYLQSALPLQHRLAQLSPTAAPEAQRALPLLKDLPALWRQMLPIEQRAVLQTMFSALYFDAQGELRKISAQPVFEKLLSSLKIQL